MLRVPLDRLGKRGTFDGATALDEILGSESMVDPLDALFNDRALIKVSCDVVGGGTDEFHTAIVGLMIRAGTFE